MLLTHDRLPGSQSGGKLLGSGDMDYLENTCLARYTGVCDFKPRMGLLLKTVDSVKASFTCYILIDGETLYLF